MKTMSLLSVSSQQAKTTKFYTHKHGHNVTNSPKSTPAAYFDLVLSITIEEEHHWLKREKKKKLNVEAQGGQIYPFGLL